MGLFDSIAGGAGAGPWGAIAGAAGSIGSSMVDYDISRKLQHDSQDFNVDFAKNRYQYLVNDLKKAGINPLYAVAGGSPPNASSGIVSSPTIDNPVSTAISSAQSVAQRENIEQNTNESRARTAKTNAEAQSASALAIIDNVKASQALNEYKTVDQGKFGQKFIGAVNSLPQWMRGPLRAGAVTAEKVSNIAQQAYDLYRYNYKNDITHPGVKSVMEDIKDSFRKGTMFPIPWNAGGMNLRKD